MVPATISGILQIACMRSGHSHLDDVDAQGGARESSGLGFDHYPEVVGHGALLFQIGARFLVRG